MTRLHLAAAVAGAVLVADCAQQKPHVPPPQNVRTIEDPSQLRSIPVEAPPTVRDESTLLRETAPLQEDERAKPIPLAPPATPRKGDDTLPAQMELPFAPAIAMDPVDGGKVSIIASTPMAEYKGKLYYFTSEQNKRAFLSNPQVYLTGQLARY